MNRAEETPKRKAEGNHTHSTDHLTGGFLALGPWEEAAERDRTPARLAGTKGQGQEPVIISPLV